MNYKIIPAIIAKDQKELNLRLDKVLGYFDRIHLDVMDGDFVQSKSLQFDFRLPSNLIYQAHLMIDNPNEWVRKNLWKVDYFIVHAETYDAIEEIISFAKRNRKKIGLALNPETSLNHIMGYLNKIDFVLVMTARPGGYGSLFLPSNLDKVKQLRKLKPSMDIAVDGGVNPDRMNMMKRAGANIFISGSYIQRSENIKVAIENLKKAIQ